MKNILLGAVVLAALGGGIFLLTTMGGDAQQAPLGGDASDNGIAEGGVTNIDLDQMAADGPALITIETEVGVHLIAVPSMGLPLCAAVENIASVSDIEVGDTVSVSGSVDPAGRIVPCEDSSHYLEIVATYSDDELGYQFTYAKGPHGYIAVEDTESVGADFLGGVMLFDRADYQEFKESTEAREGPPAISIRVYENVENLSSFVWPTRHELESNIKLATGEQEEEVVGGANAAHYLVDGLYLTDTYVVAHDNHVYVISGAYLEEESDIRDQFQSVIDSFEFISTTGQE